MQAPASCCEAKESEQRPLWLQQVLHAVWFWCHWHCWVSKLYSTQLGATGCGTITVIVATLTAPSTIPVSSALDQDPINEVVAQEEELLRQAKLIASQKRCFVLCVTQQEPPPTN